MLISGMWLTTWMIPIIFITLINAVPKIKLDAKAIIPEPWINGTEFLATDFITATAVVAGIYFGQRTLDKGTLNVRSSIVWNIQDEYGESNIN